MYNVLPNYYDHGNFMSVLSAPKLEATEMCYKLTSDLLHELKVVSDYHSMSVFDDMFRRVSWSNRQVPGWDAIFLRDDELSIFTMLFSGIVVDSLQLAILGLGLLSDIYINGTILSNYSNACNANDTIMYNKIKLTQFDTIIKSNIKAKLIKMHEDLSFVQFLQHDKRLSQSYAFGHLLPTYNVLASKIEIIKTLKE